MDGDGVHQGRREAIIGLEAKLLEPGPDFAHLLRRKARLDDRGDKGGEFRCCRTRLLKQLGMDEIQSIEWMVLVLDATIHMNAARRAGVSLDRGARVDDPELVFVRD